MKILVHSTDFLPNDGGAAVFVHNICLQLCRLGHQVDVLTLVRDNSDAIDQKQPYRVFRYSTFKRLASLVPMMKVLSLHHRNHYDLIFAGHFGTTCFIGEIILKKVFNIPFVVLSHGNDVWKFSINTYLDKIFARIVFNNSSLILANSNFTAKRILEMGYKIKIKILWPGVDENQFHPNVSCTEVRSKYDLVGKKVLLTVVRLVPVKNVGNVLKALCKVVEQVPEVRYLVVGDGPVRDQLEKHRDELGLHAYVYFLGNVEHEQLPMFYCASDVFVMPSCKTKGAVETFGISLIEASACGKPVIGGQSGGIVEAVINGKTGLLVDPDNSDDIASAIIQLLTDQEFAAQLGQNGRERIERELSWDKMGEKLGKYLESI